MQEDKPIISPQSFGDLSDLEYFAVFAKGNLVKGRLPILDPPDEGYHAPRAEKYSLDAGRARYAHEDVAKPSIIGLEDDDDGLEPPPVLDFTDSHVPPPTAPGRRHLVPFAQWVRILPGYRANDQVDDPVMPPGVPPLEDHQAPAAAKH